jgi:hypothetical protein
LPVYPLAIVQQAAGQVSERAFWGATKSVGAFLFHVTYVET